MKLQSMKSQIHFVYLC